MNLSRNRSKAATRNPDITPTTPPACFFRSLAKLNSRNLPTTSRRTGCGTPSSCYKGHILDGRNRLLACEIAGVEPEFKEWDGEGKPGRVGHL